MEDDKIGKGLEEQLDNEEQKIVKALAKEDLQTGFDLEKDGKGILIVIVAILAISTLFLGGFKLYNHLTAATILDVDTTGETYTYNDHNFVKRDGLWWTEIVRNQTLVKIPLHFGAREVKNIEITGQLNSDFNKGDLVYIAIDPDVQNKYYTLAISELSFNIAKGINRQIEGACTKENEACTDREIISCNDTQGKPIIEFSLQEEAEIELNGSCIKIKGQEYEIVKAVDRLLFHWYGIMS